MHSAAGVTNVADGYTMVRVRVRVRVRLSSDN